MYKFCVFAGTTEGRELVEFLTAQPVSVTACVATAYGQTLLPEAENLTVSARPLTVAEIGQMLGRENFDLVIDATHPYAASITSSIAAACQETGTGYLRLLRDGSPQAREGVYVSNAAEAAEFLKQTQGNILLTTGSKELKTFASLPDFAQRVYARVLPLEDSLKACREAGLPVAHILAMQGPFSQELNEGMLHALSAQWLVTKDGGSAGGFAEKAAAAQRTGARLVVIGRPPEKTGHSLEEVLALLCQRFGCRPTQKVAVLGIGPGSPQAMTQEVCRAIEQADCLIGARRMLDAVASPGQKTHTAIAPREIAGFIESHPEYRRFAVVLSGDVGFYSGAKKLIPLLRGREVQVLPGISSLVYLCAKLGLSYEDVFLTSVHGRSHNLLPDVRRHGRVFALTDGVQGVGQLCQALTEAGLGHLRVSVGQRLSYPEEEILTDTAQNLAGRDFDPLSVVLIENPHPDQIVTPGLPDSAFQRSQGPLVPMTKSEVRAVCLSKLQLTAHSVCWDIGAGTGSVSIEMALQARKGQVFAIERREDAQALLRENQRRFALENLTLVPGEAPEVCGELPAPSHVFLGGTAGNLREILKLVLEKNPGARIVAAAVTLESVAELTACLKEFPFDQQEVVSLQVARARQAGAYHLMNGQNPVYIFTMQSGKKEEIL